MFPAFSIYRGFLSRYCSECTELTGSNVKSPQHSGSETDTGYASAVAMGRAIRCDLAIVGGGLAGGLIAYALSVRRPELIVRLIEPGPAFGGNHIWSFFSNDIAADDRWIVEPFIDHSWNNYEVRFPDYRRTFGVQYNSIRSTSFDSRLRAALPRSVPVDAKAVHVTRTNVSLNSQQMASARGVIDARGASKTGLLDVGWQKFVGHEIRTTIPHGLTGPIIMDASVGQHDGFRFVYVLPLAEDRLFIEDTYYSDGPAVDPGILAERIADYAEAQGWPIAEILSRESGALPVTMGGNFEAYWRSGGDAGKVGMRAGLFHPATGYSLPDAVRTASMICAMADLSGDALADALHSQAQARWQTGGFYRLLNRMVFRAATPAQRFVIYQRFYKLRAPLIERFYAGRSTGFDKLRVLAGKPPVPIGRALKVLQET
jgi:lycopene beta-cyclase